MTHTSHVIVEFDRTDQVIVEVHHIDFPSDADASQFARDLNNDGTNCTAHPWGRWYRNGDRVQA